MRHVLSALNQALNHNHFPGLNDLNSARRNITERYLIERGCEEIFAVCRIDRATTDQCVRQVFELARRASLSSIGVVCTRSDVRALPYVQRQQYADSEQDISENEAVRDWTGGRAATMETLIQDRDESSRAIELLEADLETEDDSTDDEERSRQRFEDHRKHQRLGYGIYRPLLGLLTDKPSRRTLKGREFRYALKDASNESYNGDHQR